MFQERFSAVAREIRWLIPLAPKLLQQRKGRRLACVCRVINFMTFKRLRYRPKP